MAAAIPMAIEAAAATAPEWMQWASAAESMFGDVINLIGGVLHQQGHSPTDHPALNALKEKHAALKSLTPPAASAPAGDPAPPAAAADQTQLDRANKIAALEAELNALKGAS